MTNPWLFLIVFLLPLSVVLGAHRGGAWPWMAAAWVFVLVPVLDLLIGSNPRNPDPAAEKELAERRVYRTITWLCVPALLVLVFGGAAVVMSGRLSALETAGVVFGIGLTTGAMGINVAHELIHKRGRWENFLGFVLLWTVGYMHWGIEHVKGHHRWVATERDPATAKFGQSFYAFWPQTVFGSFRSAWRIESFLLSRKGRGAWTPRNKVIQCVLAQAALVVFFAWVWGPGGVLYYAAESFVGVSLLEIVNYLEHYGLTRKPLGPDAYEKVTPLHSWNSSHELTNYFLFNLQRHADHHAKPTRRYQILRHFEESPQLPTGYAGMLVLALVPPLWRKVMDPRVIAHREKVAAMEGQ